MTEVCIPVLLVVPLITLLIVIGIALGTGVTVLGFHSSFDKKR